MPIIMRESGVQLEKPAGKQIVLTIMETCILVSCNERNALDVPVSRVKANSVNNNGYRNT